MTSLASASKWWVKTLCLLRELTSISQAFARELKVWERFNHPNLLPLIAFHINSHDGILLFVSPYAEGGNLSTYLPRANPDATIRLQLVGARTYIYCISSDPVSSSRLTPPMVSRIYMIGKFAMVISKEYVCFRESPFVVAVLRPNQENVLVFIESNRLSARICDFGLTRIEEEGPSGLTTSTFHGKGTTSYLSPELLDSGDPKRDLKSDIWAWACVVLEVRLETSTVDAFLPKLGSRRSLPIDVHILLSRETIKYLCVSFRDNFPPTRPSCRSTKVYVASSGNAGQKSPGIGRPLPYAAISSSLLLGKPVRRCIPPYASES